jgi:hypothetical protein
MRRLTVGIAVAILLAGTAVAAASIPDASGVIHGCRDLRSGALRVIDSDKGQTCSKTEAALTWNQTGPQGPVGPAGPQGPSGQVGYYTINRSYTVTPTDSPAGLSVNCGSYGRWAISGGWRQDPDVTQPLQVMGEQTETLQTVNGPLGQFTLTVVNHGPNDVPVVVQVNCVQ